MASNGPKRPREDYAGSGDENDEEMINDADNEKHKNCFAIVVISIDKKYIESSKLLNQDIHKEFSNIKIKQLKITPANNLVMFFENRESSLMVINSQTLFKNNKKFELDNKEKKSKNNFEILIKGISFNMSKEYEEYCADKGISKFIKFNKNDDYKIVKATCATEEDMNNLISNGLFLDYIKYRVEKYHQPIKPTQCFNCQKFGHFASACEKKTSICVKCGGKHKLMDCKSSEIKCANCNGNHTSSYGGCKEFQKHQKEKSEIIKKKVENSNIRKQYSQVVSSTSSQNELSTLCESIKQINLSIINLSETIKQNVKQQLNEFEQSQYISIENTINRLFKKQEEFVANKFQEMTSKFKEELKNNISHKLQVINNQFLEFKSRIIYVQLDLIKLISPNFKPSNEQILSLT